MEKIKVTEIHISATHDMGKPYYSLTYTPLNGEDRLVTKCGYSSFYLANVLLWIQEYFEFVDIAFERNVYNEENN